MRRDLLLSLVCAVLLIFISMQSSAQALQGGFGGLQAGPAYLINPSLQKTLSADALLGSSFNANVLGSGYGGEGYTLRPRGFILGGSGYINMSEASTKNGTVNQRTSSGFFIIGHTILNTRQLFAFPYGGVGAFGTNFVITNTAEKVLLLGKDAIAPGKQARYSSGGMAFDLGFALKYIPSTTHLKSSKSLKSMIGFNTGVSFFPAFVKWQNVDNHSTLEGSNAPFLMVIYLRVTLGLGVFKHS